jgi:hypothetical protein
MTNFNFSTGNPANLVGGGGANMTDIGGAFTDLRSFLNGGSMDETNVPNLTAAFTTWKSLGNTQRAAQFIPASPSPSLVPPLTFPPASPIVTGTGNGDICCFYIDPADFNANVRTTQCRMRVTCNVGGTAPGVTLTCFLIAVTAGGSGAGAGASVVTGAAQGTSVAFASPGANTSTKTDQTAFAMPAAGRYAYQVNLSGAPAASSITDLIIELQFRQA